MKKEIKSSIVSWTVIGLAFVVALVVIFQQGRLLDKQLKATLFPVEYGSEEGIGKELMNKAMDQARKIAVAGCLKKAFEEFESGWNQECKNLGLEERCDLPKDAATPLLDQYEQLRADCQ